MGIPSEALGSRSVEYRLLGTPPAEISLSLHKVEKAGLLHRIDIRRMLIEYASADAALKLEIARQYPDLQLTPSYGFEEGFARYTFGAASTLPVFHHNQGPIQAAEARRRQIEARFRALQAQSIGEMDRALALYHSALSEWQHETERVSTLQIQREDAARRALEVGQGDRLSLALARLETNTAALAQLDALVRVQTNLGLLENSVQQPLEAGVSLPNVSVINPRHEVTH
jgi:outer membrane protein TolC